ncbi:MAG: hypothetical protein KAQ88_00310 [Hyphomicrobiaceae bacterium]|nr:hypothetical protein [Hyphomicrobiaceae bacterium]
MSLNPTALRTETCPPRARSVRAAVLALALLGMAGCSSVGSQGESAPLPGNAPAAAAAVRSAPVVPGRPARVFIFAGFGDHCEPVAAPQITITEPPAKGDVSFVPGQETTIQSSAQGTCIGEKAQGTGIYYTARAGQDGTDRFSISAKLAGGETATRTFEVRIAK